MRKKGKLGSCVRSWLSFRFDIPTLRAQLRETRERRSVYFHSFNDPRIKAKLEELMGTNVVRLTDRNYMLQLRARLLDEYEQNLRKRMKERERDEVEREKRLILSGRMPIEDAPAELEDHPVFRITQFTRKILQEKREKAMKRQTFKCKAVPVDVLVDKKINSTVGTERSKTHSNDEELRLGSCETLDKVDGPGITSSEDRRSVVIEEMAPGFMFTQEEYDNLKYEAPLVKQLRTIQDIEEMYKLADSIVGPYTLYKKPKQHQYSGS